VNLESAEELREFLHSASAEEVWGRLLYRGAAWSLMRTDGSLPDSAPPLGETIETDLAEHGFALLRAAMALREQDTSDVELINTGFEHAARAFEALVRNANPQAVDRGYRRTLAAAAYHLAGFSAVAYSLFSESPDDLNAAPAEIAVRYLVLRDLDGLRTFVQSWLTASEHADQSLAALIAEQEIGAEDAVVTILNSTICRALAYFDFALETGEMDSVDQARTLLTLATKLADHAENVPLWWLARISRHLIDDLWQHSLHQTLPTEPPSGPSDRYDELRTLFIGTLFARKNAEVELWPSQREAAQRSTDLSDDLVVALPTSAGKTRVAEIAALMTLTIGRRVLIVTPLRALSAQTERSFRATFAPLGFRVSSLYGASGLSSSDEDVLREREIIIATPEKLDFALRNDASLIDDVGLIVLDEGHMIGPTEREIRYETLVQRLLRRGDADNRRIVCLSAILPSGDELEDLTAWIRRDRPGGAVTSSWRPTRQRFGALTWEGGSGRLAFDLNDDGPFLNRFVRQKPPLGRQTLPYPRKARDLALFAAWEFAQQGKRTLVFSTQANWVEGYGSSIVDLCRRGYLESLLDEDTPIARAVEVGIEWLGANHPAVDCLKLGVALHHGKLPNPFLRELEVLLTKGTIKVIVASPTLAQGLNLNAAVLLVPSLYRSGDLIKGEEFANVAGRAGRAFVDVEGLIAHVMFDDIAWRHRTWKKLVQSTKERSLKSGLIQVVAEILLRLSSEGALDRDDAWEYLANAREAWYAKDEEQDTLAEATLAEEDTEEVAEDVDAHIDEEPLSQLVERLDATVFGLIEALDAEQADIHKLLDEALNSSLWARQIGREDDNAEAEQKRVLRARADLIWTHTTAQARTGHFAMGVGLEAGLSIDAMAADLETYFDQADVAALSGDVNTLSAALIELAERLLTIRPFIPDDRNALPANWKDILVAWVSGASVDSIGPDNMKVVEDAFTYRLVWAVEALRMRRLSLGWTPDLVSGGAAATLETGVPQLMMAMLIRSGLPSRSAAMAAINTTNAVFSTPSEMRQWLESEETNSNSARDDWPTPESVALWRRFRTSALSGGAEPWQRSTWRRRLDLRKGDEYPVQGHYRILPNFDDDGRTWMLSPDYQPIAPFLRNITHHQPALLSGTAAGDSPLVDAIRHGVGSIRWPRARTAR
jgi:RAD3-like DEAD/DEAH box helicase